MFKVGDKIRRTTSNFKSVKIGGIYTVRKLQITDTHGGIYTIGVYLEEHKGEGSFDPKKFVKLAMKKITSRNRIP